MTWIGKILIYNTFYTSAYTLPIIINFNPYIPMLHFIAMKKQLIGVSSAIKWSYEDLIVLSVEGVVSVHLSVTS